VGDSVDERAAVAWLQRESETPCRVPIGVIGPREAEAAQTAAAADLGRGLAGLGLVVLCGGKSGVMEAACEGVAAAGGLSIGLLPDEDAAAANPHVSVPIATGIGVARNAIIARAALCLVAVGGGYGTLSEVAFALQFGKPVIGLCGAPEVPGVHRAADVGVALGAVARAVLALPL
jgi:uncharacterized protein (TIGR00725 family)